MYKINFKKLDPVKEGNRKWRFATLEVVKYKIKHIDAEFKDESGVLRAFIKDNELNILPNYAWNGCSPKYFVGIWWGTPDFEKSLRASLIHDVLYQFSDNINFCLSFQECNDIFYNIGKEDGFKLVGVYYYFVNKFGKSFFKERKV